MPFKPAPVITAITPDYGVRTAATAVTVSGTGFIPTTLIEIRDSAATTVLWSTAATYYTYSTTGFTLPAGVLLPGVYAVVVKNPPTDTTDGGESLPVLFEMRNPAATLLNVSPDTLTRHQANVTLTLTGTDFVTTATVFVGDVALLPTYISSTMLTVNVPAENLNVSGTVEIKVWHPRIENGGSTGSPTGGGGYSNTINLHINNPEPKLLALTPQQLTATADAVQINLTGTGFVPGMTAQINRLFGEPIEPMTANLADITDTTAVLNIPANTLMLAGNYSVSLQNPAPYAITGLTTGILTVLPGVAIQAEFGGVPATLTAGQALPAFTVSYKDQYGNLTDFEGLVSFSKVDQSSTGTISLTRTALGVSTATQVMFNQIGSYTLNIANITGMATLEILPPPLPILSAISPSTTTATFNGFTLTIKGDNFVEGVQVKIQDLILQTTRINPTTITTFIPKSIAKNAKTYSIAITNPLDTGSVSNNLPLTIEPISHYRVNGEPIPMIIDSTTVILMFSPITKIYNSQDIYSNPVIKNIAITPDSIRTVVQFHLPQSVDVLPEIGIDTNLLEYYSYGYKFQSGDWVIPTNRVVFELKHNTTLDSLQALFSNEAAFEKILLSNTTSSIVTLKQNSQTESILLLSEEIHKSGLVKWVHPDFIVNITQYTDPFYPLQHYLNYVLQEGVRGIDIRAEEAWQITKGSNTITVAVIDDGVEVHEDLPNLLLGFSPHGGNGSPLSNDCNIGHGQACAGIIGAAHNNLGVRGVAPNVNIYPVAISFSGFLVSSTIQIADAIKNASDHADILSCSWGASPGANFPVISGAIDYARTMGRNGLGSVVIFAAGNHRRCNLLDASAFPASVPGVLSVGAIYKENGSFWDYSAREVHLVAPSGNLSGVYGDERDCDPFLMEPPCIPLHGNVVTTDRTGGLGYAPMGDNLSANNNYTFKFGGTSAAAPQVAGAAALLLSINPTLTEWQVRNILTCSGSPIQAGRPLLNLINLLAPQPEISSRVLGFGSRAFRYTASMCWIPNNTQVTWSVQYVSVADGSLIDAPYTPVDDQNIIVDWPLFVNEGRITVTLTNPIWGAYQTTKTYNEDIGAYSLAQTINNDEMKTNFSSNKQVDGNNNNITVSISPNPVSDNAELKYRTSEKAFVNIEIYNTFGTKVKTIYQGTQSAGEYLLHLNVSTLPPGIYTALIRMVGKNNVSQKAHEVSVIR